MKIVSYNLGRTHVCMKKHESMNATISCLTLLPSADHHSSSPLEQQIKQNCMLFLQIILVSGHRLTLFGEIFYDSVGPYRNSIIMRIFYKKVKCIGDVSEQKMKLVFYIRILHSFSQWSATSHLINVFTNLMNHLAYNNGTLYQQNSLFHIKSQNA